MVKNKTKMKNGQPSFKSDTILIMQYSVHGDY